MSLMSLTAVALGKKIQAGEVTVEEAVLDALEQIEKKEDTIHSGHLAELHYISSFDFHNTFPFF